MALCCVYSKLFHRFGSGDEIANLVCAVTALFSKKRFSLNLVDMNGLPQRKGYQATKFCSIRVTGFCYFYFTVPVTTNDSSVPSRSIAELTIVLIGVTTNV